MVAQVLAPVMVEVFAAVVAAVEAVEAVAALTILSQRKPTGNNAHGKTLTAEQTTHSS